MHWSIIHNVLYCTRFGIWLHWSTIHNVLYCTTGLVYGCIDLQYIMFCIVLQIGLWLYWSIIHNVLYCTRFDLWLHWSTIHNVLYCTTGLVYGCTDLQYIMFCIVLQVWSMVALIYNTFMVYLPTAREKEEGLLLNPVMCQTSR